MEKWAKGGEEELRYCSSRFPAENYGSEMGTKVGLLDLS